MRRGKKIGIVLLAIASLTLTACGATVPEMTEEESAQVVEYAAGLLLKYDKNYNGRLVDEELLADTQEEPKQPEVIKEEPEMPQEEAPSVDAATQDDSQASNKSVQEFYGIEGVEVIYNGFEVKDIYPDSEEEEVYFAMNAEQGKKLLILNFEMKNITGQSLDIDMVSKGAKFKLSINGGAPRYALTTMLMNDMATFAGTIEAGESENLVLISEILEEEAGSISSVSLVMK